MFEPFSDRARMIMALANEEAQRRNHEYIGAEHILVGLVREGSGVAAGVLKKLEVDLPKVRMELDKLVKNGPDMVATGRRPQTPRAKKVIERAILESRSLNHNYVGSEHLLLGLLGDPAGIPTHILGALGIELDRVRQEVLDVLGASARTTPSAADATEDNYAWEATISVQENPMGSFHGSDRQSLFGDSKLLRLFLLDRDATCPRCGYNLRDLTEPRCPECGEALTLKVSAQRPIFGLFWVTILPGILSGVCAIVLLVLLQFDPQVPPAVWWVDLFGFVSGASVAVFFTYRRAFSRRSEKVQLTVAVIVWLVHVVVFLVLARTY
ncbi:MAG: hypothetical protein IID37_03385 [Planctomycetes bacterium]|nr:hypothetical protein [Planctomycetota bacterium]